MNYPTTYQVWYTFEDTVYCETFSDQDEAMSEYNLHLSDPDHTNVMMQIIEGVSDAD